MTLEELIDEARQDQEKEPWLDNRRVPEHLFNHVKYMESKNYSPYRIKNGINIVRTFYNQFQITLPKIKYQGEPESFYQKVDDLPNYQDIRKALNISNIKYRAIITLMASSALNTKDIRLLKVKDFLEAIGIKTREIDLNEPLHVGQLVQKHHRKIGIWERIREKTQIKFITFSTPESTNMILDYLDYHSPLSIDDYLFRSDEQPDQPMNDRSIGKYLPEDQQTSKMEKREIHLLFYNQNPPQIL